MGDEGVRYKINSESLGGLKIGDWKEREDELTLRMQVTG